jgi:hypothetical protein
MAILTLYWSKCVRCRPPNTRRCAHRSRCCFVTAQRYSFRSKRTPCGTVRWVSSLFFWCQLRGSAMGFSTKRSSTKSTHLTLPTKAFGHGFRCRSRRRIRVIGRVSRRPGCCARFADGEFFEVYVNTPINVVEARDVKGLYRRARSGGLPKFTDVDSVYEPPLTPELVPNTELHTAEQCAAICLRALGWSLVDR